jgi:hypothetical protein
MNDWDKNNLEFLMSLKTPEDWDDWAKYCEPDDFLYAIELVRTAQAELLVQVMQLEEDEAEAQGKEYSEANAVLNKFRLNRD